MDRITITNESGQVKSYAIAPRKQVIFARKLAHIRAIRRMNGSIGMKHGKSFWLLCDLENQEFNKITHGGPHA